MANKFLIRRGDGAPGASTIDEYELVYDYTNNQLYTKVGTTITAVGGLTSVNNTNWSGTDLAIVNGGTGASTAAAARTNLGVDPAGTDNSTPVTIAAGKDYITISGQELTLGSVNLTTDITGALPITNGGTGATLASTARSNLGLAIGTNVQAYDTYLQDIADLSPTFSEDGYVLTYEDSSDSFVLSAAASGGVTSVATGGGLTGGPITSTGTISHADTSSAANLTASSRTYVTGLTFDTYGHVTGYTTGTETVTDTNTTYTGTDGVTLVGTSFRADSTVLRTDTIFGGDVSGAYNSIVVADDSHNHIISNVDGLQTALDGKLSTSGTAANSTLLNNLGAGSFLRSDAADTASGVITFSNRITSTGTEGFTIGNYAGYDRIANDANTFKFITDGNGYANMAFATVTTGSWNGSVIASAYLDADTAHLSGTQTFTGAKTFSSDIISNGIEVGTAYGSDNQYLGIKRSAASANDYIIMQGSGSDVGSTYISAGSGKNVNIRPSANSTTNQLVVSTSGTTIGGNTVWHAGNDGSNSGLDADLLDGLHGSSYWSKSGSWVGDLGSNGYTRVQGVSNGGGEFVLALKNGQLHTLVDGSYIAYEASSTTGGGFWSSYNSAYGNASGFKASANDRIRVQQLDGGTADLEVTGNIKLTNEKGLLWDYTPDTGMGGYIAHPGGGMYRTTTSTHTGAITITIPSGGGPADMLSFWVDIFDYASNKTISYFIAGYIYQTAGSNEWVNVSATQISNNTNYERAVRFGHNGTNHLVYIGELADTWSHPQVTVRNVQVGYAVDADTYDDNWDISFEATAFANVDETITNTLVQAGKIKMADGAGQFIHNTTSTRDKIRVWNQSNYAIGMQTGFTFGGLGNNYAMTFQMNNQADRGFWWGDDGHGQAAGAMALTTDGKLTVAHSARIGYGESDTTTPGASYRLDVSGNALVTGTMYASTIQTDSGNLNLSGGGWGMNFYIDTDANSSDNYNFYSDNALRHILGGDGNVTFGKTSNPTLSIMNTATAAGSGPTLEFGHDQGGGARAGAISTYLTDGSTANRTALLRFWHTQANADILKMQMGDNYVRQYQKGDVSDYLETIVNDDYVEFHVAHGNYVQINTNSGVLDIGPMNASWCHFQTDRPGNYFNKKVTVDTGTIESYDEDLQLRRAQSSDDRIVIEADQHSHYVNGSKRLEVKTTGIVAQGNSQASTYFQCNQNGSTLKRYVSGWTNATTHDVILNAYQTTLGDYVYLKASGNSTTTHGIIVVSDNYIFMGRDNLTEGGIDNSATAPITDCNFRLDSTGNALFDGDVVAYSTTIASDARLKENVEDLNYGLKDVLDIRPVSFDWKDKRNGQHDIGVIAQEIEKIIPEVVVEVDTLNSEDTHKTVDYAKLTSVLIKAIQEQQQQINELKEQLNG